MRVKLGVQLDGVHYLMVYAAAVYDYLRQAHGYGEGTITGGVEGADAVGPMRVVNTLHPHGYAIDVRTTDLPPDRVANFGSALQAALGSMFRVVVEEDHIHIQLNMPGRTVGV